MASQRPLAGRNAIITGASRGIGLAIAHELGSLGARLSVCARDGRSLDAAVNQLRNAGIESMGRTANVSSWPEVTALIEETRKTFGSIDVLVNNAGIGVFGAAHQLSEQDWDRVLQTNLRGAFLCTKAVAPHMMQQRSGDIINISSLAGKNAFAGGAAYCASKWGLQGFSYCAAEDLRGYGIRVSVVCPGSVATEFSPHAGKSESKMLQPADVAHVVAMIVTQAPHSFASEVLLRPTQKP